MVEITNFRQGAILNHNHGTETGRGLAVTVRGISATGRPVRVNGRPAAMDGRNFNSPVELRERINRVVATVATPYGNYAQEIDLAWDRKSFRRYHFNIDDHSFLFTGLAKERPKSAFDHFYLAGLKKIHEKYGLKVTLNCFYHDDHHDFELKDMPDTWKSEFVANSDWLRFSFHAYGEFPDRPYLESSAEEFGRDYTLVRNEIIRFAGEEAWIPPVIIHWGNIHPAVLEELIARGTRAYSSSCRPRVMGGPALTERRQGWDRAAVEERTRKGDRRLSGVPENFRVFYLDTEEEDYLEKHRAYYNAGIGIFIFGGGGCTCNLVPKGEIAGRYEKIFAAAAPAGAEVFGGGSHEQYSFPGYGNYLPDHMERMEEAVRCLAEGGCRAVFFNEGILGNTAWEAGQA